MSADFQGIRLRIAAIGRQRWIRIAAVVAGVPLLALCFIAGYYYVSFSRIIDARLHGERQRVLPQVFARPLELRKGQSLTDQQLIDRLNDLGYAERAMATHPGEFAVAPGRITIVGRAPDLAGRPIHISFVKAAAPAPRRSTPPRPPPPPPAKFSDRIEQMDLGGDSRDRIVLEAPVLTAL